MSEWVTAKLADVVTLQRGHDLPSQKRVSGNIPIIGSFGITGTHNVAKYPGPGVAIGRSGASIGAATYCKGDYWPLNTCLFVKDFRGNDPRWVYYLLDSIDFSIFNSGSAQPSLNRNYLADIQVSLPPIREQKAIANLLGALDDKIESNKLIARLTQDLMRIELARLLREANTQKVKISELVTVRTERNRRSSADHPYVGLEHMPGFDLSLWEWGASSQSKTASKVFKPGDVLFGRIRPYFGKVVSSGLSGVCAESIEVLAPRNQGLASLVPLVLSSREVIDFATSVSTGTTMPQVSWDDVGNFEVSIPSGPALASFEARCSEGLDILRALPFEVARLAATRDALIPSLLSGKIRVTADTATSVIS